MTPPRLLLPPMDAEPWPTLGPEVCDWIEAHLVHGPGDALGVPVILNDETRLLLYRAYEVYPHGHPQAGRRRFKRVVVSRRKGWAKTEIAAMIAIAEMDPTSAVRCDGFRNVGTKREPEWEPVGRPVRDPYIPMVSVTEEQTADLAYGTALAILEHCDLGNSYVLSRDRIQHLNEPGKMTALASAPGARDGARTSFQHFDETHLFVSARLKSAHQTMLRNVPKRVGADAWSLETTTMYAPGEESVAEDSHRYAEEVEAGLIEDPRLLFDHRQAAETHDITKRSGLVAAIKEASGDALAFTDVESIAASFRDPTQDKNQLRRFWLNQRRRSARRWMSDDAWESCRSDRAAPAAGLVVLAFDGSYSRDSTGLVACTVEEKPMVFVVEAWERPSGQPRWRTPRLEVDAALESAMERFQVVELAPDPPGWHREIEEWEETYGEVVVRFETNQPSRMGPACDDFTQAVRERELEHDGDPRLARHVSNCVTARRGPYELVTKESKDSPFKIDLAVGAIVAYSRARWHFLNPVEDEPEPLYAFA